MSAHGDLATNIILQIANRLERSPQQLAHTITEMLEFPSDVVSRVEVAGPGFINFWLTDAALATAVNRILQSGSEYGRSTSGAGSSVRALFLPPKDGEPLYVGFGRCAVAGDVIAAVLQATGHDVIREFVADDSDGHAHRCSAEIRDLEDVGIRFDRIARRSQLDVSDPAADASSGPLECGVLVDRDGVPWQRVRPDAWSGQQVSLREFFERVGVDAARYFFLAGRDAARPAAALDLAAVQSEDNPVYYVQYAHARIAAVLHRAGLSPQELAADAARLPDALAQDARDLIRLLALYPVVVARAARAREPHRIVGYLEKAARMANEWHRVRYKLGAQQTGEPGEMALNGAVLIVLANALNLLGISAPERM